MPWIAELELETLDVLVEVLIPLLQNWLNLLMMV